MKLYNDEIFMLVNGLQIQINQWEQQIEKLSGHEKWTAEDRIGKAKALIGKVWGLLPHMNQDACKHEWQSTFLTEELFGFICINCGKEVVDPGEGE